MGTNDITLSSAGFWATDAGDNVISIATGVASPLALGSTITFTANDTWTIAWRGKQAASDNKGMTLGDNTNTKDFIWMNSGNIVTYRNDSASDFSKTGSAGDTTTKADWALTYLNTGPGVGTLQFYRNGSTFGTSNTSGVGSLIINMLGNAYTSTTFALQGQLDYVYIWSGRALNSSEVSSLASDPYGIFGTSTKAPPPFKRRTRFFMRRP